MGMKNDSKVDYWLLEDNLMLLSCWCRDGYTDSMIAERIMVNPGTLTKWKKQYPEIAEALSRGKEVVDYKVENALLKSALGYKYKERKFIKNIKTGEIEKVEITEKEVQPNTTAIAIWLNNRKPKDWKRNRDNVIDNNKDSNITVNIIKHSEKGSNKNTNREVDLSNEEEWEVETIKPEVKEQKKEKKIEKKARVIKREEPTQEEWDAIDDNEDTWD